MMQGLAYETIFPSGEKGNWEKELSRPTKFELKISARWGQNMEIQSNIPKSNIFLFTIVIIAQIGSTGRV